MRDDSRYREDDRETRRRRPQPPVRPGRKKWYWLLLLPAATAGLCLLGCGGAVVGYLVFGIQRTSDPAQVRASLHGMTDVDLPPGLEPDTKSLEMTGVETVEFRSGSRRSYLIISTGPRFQLQHSGTLRDARDRGKVAGGGRPESPAEERTIKATVRGQPAEFIYRRYSDTETVSGYFQGKQHPAHLEAEFSLREFAPGTSGTLVQSIH